MSYRNGFISRWVLQVIGVVFTATFVTNGRAGVVVFITPPADYPELQEFRTLTKRGVAFSDAILATGKRVEIPNGGIIAVIESPPGKPDANVGSAATVALQQIESALKRFPRSKYPHVARTLEPLAASWRNAQTAARSARLPVTAVPPTSKPTSSLTLTTLDGQRFEDAIITRVDSESISFEYAAGVATLPLAKLTADLQKRFNYDPKILAAKVAKQAEKNMPNAGVDRGAQAITPEEHSPKTGAASVSNRVQMPQSAVGVEPEASENLPNTPVNLLTQTRLLFPSKIKAFGTSWTEQQIAMQDAKNEAQLKAENPFVLEGVFAFQNYTAVNAAARKTLAEALDAFGLASNDEERYSAGQALGDAIKRVSGREAGQLTRTMGPDALQRGLSPESNKYWNLIILNFDQSLNKGYLQSIVENVGLNAGTGLDAKQAGEIAHTFFAGFPPAKRENLLKSIGTEDFARLIDEHWATSHDQLTPRGIDKARMDRLKQQGQRPVLRNFLETARSTMSAMPEFANMRSAL